MSRHERQVHLRGFLRRGVRDAIAVRLGMVGGGVLGGFAGYWVGTLRTPAGEEMRVWPVAVGAAAGLAAAWAGEWRDMVAPFWWGHPPAGRGHSCTYFSPFPGQDFGEDDTGGTRHLKTCRPQSLKG
jgi:hypothetical protein